MNMHTNKLGIGFDVRIEHAYKEQRFYSEDIITNDKLSGIIIEVLSGYENITPSIFDPSTMQIKVDTRKTLSFYVQKNALISEEFDKVERTELKNGIKTQIIFDVQESVSGTEICIEVLKKLQKKYPRSIFVGGADVFIRGNDIQNLRMNKKDMYDPGMRSITEITDEEFEKLKLIPMEERKTFVKEVEKTLIQPVKKKKSSVSPKISKKTQEKKQKNVFNDAVKCSKPIDIKAAKLSNAKIAEHLIDPLNSAGAYARQLIYFDLVKDGLFEMTDVATDQLGNEMVILRLCTDEQIDNIPHSMQSGESYQHDELKEEHWPLIVNFDALAHYCVRRQMGAYIATEDDPSSVRGRIKYGAIWSFCEYGELGGNDFIRQQYETALGINISNPFEALVGESQNATFSYPSEDILSSFLKDILTDIIKGIIPDSRPKFLLKTEKCYALPHSICVDLGKELPEELEHKITDTLMFYVPPFLPIHVDSIPKEIIKDIQEAF